MADRFFVALPYSIVPENMPGLVPILTFNRALNHDKGQVSGVQLGAGGGATQSWGIAVSAIRIPWVAVLIPVEVTLLLAQRWAARPNPVGIGCFIYSSELK